MSLVTIYLEMHSPTSFAQSDTRMDDFKSGRK